MHYTACGMVTPIGDIAHVLIIRRSKLHDTASGIITPRGVI